MGFKLKRLLKQPKKILKQASEIYKPIKKVVSPLIKRVVGSVPLIGPIALAGADAIRGVRKSLRGAVSKEDRAAIRESVEEFQQYSEADQQFAQQQAAPSVQQFTNPYFDRSPTGRRPRFAGPRGPYGAPLSGDTAFSTSQFMRFRRAMAPQVQQGLQRQQGQPAAPRGRNYFSSGRFFR